MLEKKEGKFLSVNVFFEEQKLLQDYTVITELQKVVNNLHVPMASDTRL